MEAGESMAGTANDGVTTWVLLEQPGQWGAKVPRDAEGLAPAVREGLMALDRNTPGLRAQLIRRPGGMVDPLGRPRLIVAALDPADPGRSRVVSRLLEDPLEAAQLDPEAELAGETGALALAEPVYLVCTHGARDRCCAKWGMPVFQRLCQLAGEGAPARVWQASHLGGHRFAPVVLTLPDGYVYGRVGMGDTDPAVGEADTLFAATEAGRIYDLERLRGRACLNSAAQWVDIELRRRHGLRGHHALSLASVSNPVGARERTEVTFDVTGGHMSLTIELEDTPLAVLGSCGDGELKQMRPWRAVGT